jgi:hypothetical protein
MTSDELGRDSVGIVSHKLLAERAAELVSDGQHFHRKVSKRRTVPGGTVHALHPDGRVTMCGQAASGFLAFSMNFEDAAFLRRCKLCRAELSAPRARPAGR